MRPIPTLSSALPAGGGFFLPSYDPNPATSSSSSRNLVPLPTEPQDALRLSPVQLTRLRSHLDARILSIQRRWAKRFHQQQQTSSEGAAGVGAAGEAVGSSTSAADPLLSGGPALDSVGKYVSAWTDEVPPLLVRVDPVGASQSTTLVAYAMRMTELLLMGVVGYESLEDREREGEHQSLGEQGGEPGGEQQQQQPPPTTSGLTRLLQALHLLDALWASLLAGRRLSLPHAIARSSASLSLASSSSTSSTTSANAAQSTPGAPPPARDSLPLSGSLGIKTLSGTDRVRLRNLLVDRRSEVRRWVGDVLGVILAGPAPGEEEEEQGFPGGGPSRLSGVLRGSMPPMQRRSRRGKRGRAALVESQDQAEEAAQRDGIAEEVKEESDVEKGEVLATPAAAPEAKRRKHTRGNTKRATQIKEETVNDAVDEDNDDEEEMEEVTVPLHAENGTRSQAEQRVKQEQGNEEEDKADEAETETETDEHRHYQALFDRKIELDDDDDNDDDDENRDEGEHEEAGEPPEGNEGEAPHPPLDPQETPLPADVNGNGQGSNNGSANGHGHADMGRLGSFELDVLLARLFSRSLALLERLE